jgi:hypothetical protein
LNKKAADSATKQLNGYNLGSGFDLDHTTLELLNDAMECSPGAACHHRSSMLKASSACSIC